MWGKKFLISYRVSFPVSIEIFKAVDLKDLFRDLEIVQDPLQERLIETERYNLTSVVKYTGVDKKKCKKILAGRQTKRPSMYIVQTGMNDRGKHKYRRQENWQDIEKNTKG